MAANLYDLFLDEEDRPGDRAGNMPSQPAPRATGRLDLDGAADRYGIPRSLARALVQTESGGRDDAVSPKGARGVTQVMPDTMRQMGYDPAAASPADYLDAGMGYLRQQYDRFGRWDLALAAYHAGPGRVRDGQVPDTSDGIMRTPAYVRRILARAGMEPDAEAPQPRQAPRTILDLMLPSDDARAGGARAPRWEERFEAAMRHVREAPPGTVEELRRGVVGGVERLGAGLSALAGRSPQTVASDLADVANIPRSADQVAYEERLAAAAKAFDDASGFAESTRAFIDVLRAVGSSPTQAARTTVESLASSAPAFGGAAAGALGGAAVGGPVGSVLGGIIGFLGGSLATNTQVEMASRLDKRLRDEGVDTRNIDATVAALEQNPTLVADAKAEAIRAGLATTAVEGVFDLATVGAARFTKPARSLIGTAMRGGAAALGQGVSEGLGAYAGDYAADGDPSAGQALVEGVLGVIPGIPEAAAAVYAGRRLPIAAAISEIGKARTPEEAVQAATQALLPAPERRIVVDELVDDSQRALPAPRATPLIGYEPPEDARVIQVDTRGNAGFVPPGAQAEIDAARAEAQQMGLTPDVRAAQQARAGGGLIEGAMRPPDDAGPPDAGGGAPIAPVPAPDTGPAGAAEAVPRESTAMAGATENDYRPFAPTSGTLGVPRAQMPQVRPETHGPLVNFLKARGIESTLDEVPATSLKPSQAEYSPTKVEGAMSDAADRRVLVSADGYIVDGHHRWLGALLNDAPIKVIRFDAPVEQLLGQVREFPSSGQADGGMAPTTATASTSPYGEAPSTSGAPGGSAQAAVAPPPLVPPPRAPAALDLSEQDVVAEVESMAREAGWAEVGGRLIRRGGDGTDGSETVSRTKWVPRAEWWATRESRLPGDQNGDATREAVRRALAGERLSAAQRRAVDEMMRIARGRIADMRGEPAADVTGSVDEARAEREAIQAEAEYAVDQAFSDDEINALLGELSEDTQELDDETLRAIENDGLRILVEEDAGGRGAAPADPAGARRGADAGGGQARPADAQEGLTPAPQGPDDFALAGQTPEQLRAADDARRREEADRARRDAAPPADDFVLTGSDSPADQARARGQMELGDAPPTEGTAATPPADEGAPTEGVRDEVEGQGGRWQEVLTPPGGGDALRLTAPAVDPKGPQDGNGLRESDRYQGRVDSDAAELAGQIKGESGEPDFIAAEAVAAIKQWAKDSRVAADDLRDAVYQRLPQTLVGRLKKAWMKEAKKPPAAPPARGPIVDAGSKIGGARKDTATSTGPRTERTTEDDDRPTWAKRYRVTEPMDVASRGKFHVWDARTKEPVRQGWRVMEFATREEAEAAIPLIAVSAKHKVVAVTRTGGSTAFEIWRIVTDRKRVKVVEQQFDTREAALAHMAANAAAILETRTSFGEDILPAPQEATRRGAPRRTGNVTGDDFMATFALRGVEFGNWQNQAERQEVMNMAYDGLLDLADVLGVPPRALGMAGELGLAFGARGHGLAGARAHYEGDYGAINLTKMKGAGSLAHEFFHALDHYFRRQDEPARAQRRPNEAGDMVFPGDSASDQMASAGLRGTGVRAEVRAAFREILDTIQTKAEQYVEDTARAQKFVKAARDGVDAALRSVRDDIAKDLTYRSRKNKAATPEQLAQWDAIAERLLNGEDRAYEFRPNGTRAAAMSGRWSNDSLDALSAIFKDVRGRSGFTAERSGPLDRVATAVRAYDTRLKMLESAEAADVKTKRVPTDFAMNARRIDEGRVGDYWTLPHEMAARAFSAYVEDRLAARGDRSDFLSFGSNNDMPVFRMFNIRPFPEGAEREAIDAAFDRFFAVLQTREDDGRTVMFSRGSATRGMPIKRLTGIVAGIRSRWANAPDIEVVASAADLPQRVRAEIGMQEAGGAEAPPQGVYWNGTVYLVADQLATEGAVVETLLHEALGHYGLRGVFGERLNGILDRVALARPQRMREKARDYGLDIRDVEQRRAVAEEILAEMAGESPTLSLVQRAIAAIRQWVRDAFGLELELTDADLVSQFLLPARAFVADGPNALARPASRVGRSVKAQLDKLVPNRRVRHAKMLAQLAQSPAFQEQGFGGLDIPTQRMVLGNVRAVIHNREIADAVVRLLPVDVVDDLGGQQLAPEALLHDEAMLADLFVADGDKSVAPRHAATELVRAAASVAAERILVDELGRDLVAGGPAVRARNLNAQREVERATARNIATSGRTGELEATGGGEVERSAAVGAVGGRHDDIVDLPARRFVEQGAGRGPALAPAAAASSRTASPFYSELARRIGEAKSNAMPAAEWARWIDANAAKLGIKADEVEWSGIREYLALRGKQRTTKEEVLDFLGEHGVQVGETVLGGVSLEKLRGQLGSRRDELTRLMRAYGFGIDGGIGEQPFIFSIDDDTEFEYDIDQGAFVNAETGDALPMEVRGFAEEFASVSSQLFDISEGETPPGVPRYGSYRVPGRGIDYTEMLLTLPAVGTDAARIKELNKLIDGKTADYESLPDDARRAVREEIKAWRDERTEIENRVQRARFRSNHWDEPNVLVHTRFDTRDDADGRKVLFVHEIQSDWGQAGRKTGFKGDSDPATQDAQALVRQTEAELDAMRAEVRSVGQRATAVWQRLQSKMAGRSTLREVAQLQDEHDALQEQSRDLNTRIARTEGRLRVDLANLAEQRRRADRAPPRGPFVPDTKAWVGLALKRLIRHAAETGHERVVLVTGEQAAEVFDLRKQIDHIEWAAHKTPDGGTRRLSVLAKDVDDSLLLYLNEDGVVLGGSNEPFAGKDLAAIVGKELAEKIMAAPSGYLEDDGLAIGGEGMKAFYDRLVPQVARDVVKKLGAGAVTTQELQIPGPGPGSIDRSSGAVLGPDADRVPGVESRNVAIDITPELRAKAMAGMPMFARAAQTATEAFRRWFGESKVVDANGEPLVVYHGSEADITEFRSGAALGTGINNGIYFAEDARLASVFARHRGAVYPVYLSIKNPLDLTTRFPTEGLRGFVGAIARRLSSRFDAQVARDEALKRPLGAGALVSDSDLKALRAAGYDGIKTDGAWIAFDPGQVKSATGNRGTFDPSSGDIRFSRPTGRRTWDAPESSKLDDALYTLADKQIDLKRVVQAIRAKVGDIADRWNAYLQEELYHGRTAKRVKDFLDFELRPLLTDMQMRGVTLADFEKYLHARHAEERNVQIAKINPKMPDGGSGMSTADARAYLAGLEERQRRAFDALASRIDAISSGTRQVLVDSGLEKPETIERWAAAYKAYVPLMRDEVEDSGTGTGMGYSVRGPASRRAMGSDKRVVDIVANLAMQRERAIIRAEKNRVAQALYGLAVKNRNPEFWKPVNSALFPALSESARVRLQEELADLGLDPQDAAGLVREPVQRYVDPRDGLVHERVNPALRGRDNVLSLRVDGEDRFVFFNATDDRAKRMAASLKNLDTDTLGRVLSTAAVISRWFASVNTQYNPIFGVVNLTRDVQGALFNLSTTPIAGRQREVLGHTVSALRGIYADIRAHRAGEQPSSKWAQLWEEFQREGGQTGFRDMWANPAERTESLEKEIRAIGQGPVRGAGRAIFNWLSDYNETLENAVRLAAYKVAVDAGQSRERAASIAKNITVNFNRKGQITQQAGALYAFFNASVQGTMRLAETLRGPAGKKIVAGGLILGSAQALLLAAAGFDERDPPEFVRERNLVLPIGDGRYATIPMPLGLHVLPGVSRIVTEWVLSGFKRPGDRVAQMVGMFAETFNPVGNAGLSLQTLAPTAIDPLAALAENRDWQGRPIARENMNPMQPQPGFVRTRDTASALSKELAHFLNLASGGSDFAPGLLSPTPDQIDYLIGQVTGGVGRELIKAQQTVGGAVTGEEVPPYKVPLLGRFVGDSTSGASESALYYDNLKAVYRHKAEMDGRRDRGESVALYMRENPEARLVMMAGQVDRDVDELRRRKREAVAQGAQREAVARIDESIKTRMRRFNERVAELSQ